MMVIAKMGGKIVEVVKFARTVQFSDEKGWFLLCFDFDKEFRRREQYKWVTAKTQFVWVREFIGE